MSVYLPVTGGMVGGGVAATMAFHFGASEPIALIAAVVGGLLGLAAWVYSPLPSTNGGMFAPPARKQKWGWTSEPATEYEKPDSRDYMTQKLVGINWAKEAGGDDDGD